MANHFYRMGTELQPPWSGQCLTQQDIHLFEIIGGVFAVMFMLKSLSHTVTYANFG